MAERRMFEGLPVYAGLPAKYVGVYIFDWQEDWGEPTMGFVEVEDTFQEGWVIARQGDTFVVMERPALAIDRVIGEGDTINDALCAAVRYTTEEPATPADC